MNVEVGRDLYDIPGAGLPVVRQVDVVLVVEEGQGHLVPGEGPGPELHDAGLLVEREVRHVYRARRLKQRIYETKEKRKNLSINIRIRVR